MYNDILSHRIHPNISMIAQEELNYRVHDTLMGREGEPIPAYSTNMDCALEVLKEVKTWAFSKRQLFLRKLLGELITEDPDRLAAWPDALFFLRPWGICIAALETWETFN